MTDMSAIELHVADSESTRQLKLGEVVEDISWETTLLDQPGKLTFTYNEANDSLFGNGSNVVLAVGTTKIFDGYLFERTRQGNKKCSCTCYDRLRYLNNKDTYVFEGKTVNDIFSTICTEQEIPFSILAGSDFVPTPMANDNKSLYSMITQALDEQFLSSNKYLIIFDNGGQLVMQDVENMVTNVFIGDTSLLQDFKFTSSIDSQTYNYVKLVQENKEAQVRYKYIAMDSSTIYKWGRLQYFEKVDEDMNEAQIIERANQMLKLYNRETKTLTVSCLGDFQVRAGSGVGVGIDALQNEGIAYMQYTFASKVTHKLSKYVHTMDLDLEVV